ncbi:beta-N-acetylhexosaminidase [Gynurincola endophyticus]|uniref:beta-N-acetylhexosaminidase n=1 Tax=Gynurincola endophyticus TaxID=2479004 RepID=UPI000F8E7747|nr:beta-N-acetylhexosaminidase [Gynurincola endophyticus]
MKRFLFPLSFCISISILSCSDSTPVTPEPINIIPEPVSVQAQEGVLKIKKSISISLPEDISSHLNAYVNEVLSKSYGLSTTKGSTASAQLQFELKEGMTGITPYELVISDQAAKIIAGEEKGLFYGFQTFLQLFPAEKRDVYGLPAVNIQDHAQFEYRGLHLDVSRHFFGLDFIKKYIDLLAYHKFSKFHWHLTDDQGWRIEIKKYPELTDTGAYRNGTVIGRYPGTGNDNTRYGGYYTHEQVKEVLAYAASRYIEVIPEIELPGHASAAIAAYPELSCFPQQPTVIEQNMSEGSRQQQAAGRIKVVQETWGVFDDVFCAGKESTFEFLENVLAEVAELFPSKYLHIGGDECPKTHWKKCAACQKRMKENGLKDEHELQSYFVTRIEKFLNQKGKTIIGWDEILEGGLAPNAIVMSWRGQEGGRAAARMQHFAIMTPTSHSYLDYNQTEKEDSVTIGGFISLEKVYNYIPVPDSLSEAQAKFIMGGQGNVWTEYMHYPSKVEYMVYPRATALSEVLWSTKKDYKRFLEKMNTQYKRYGLWSVNAFPAQKLN